MFADPALAPVLELAHLAGREGPQIETQQAWDTWGVSFRCILAVPSRFGARFGIPASQVAALDADLRDALAGLAGGEAPHAG